jgi:DNA-binding response OmpR family regulator
MDSARHCILVVDDDASLRLLCRVNLELDGFEVREAATEQEVRAAIEAERPDAVLLDVHLGPSGDSLGLLDDLRAAGIPTALVTGTADVNELKARADAVLPKPFLPNDLVAVARRLVVR